MDCSQSIPEYIKDILERYDIEPLGIRLKVYADLSLDGEYCDIWIVVTSDRLAMVRVSSGEKGRKPFTGHMAAGKEGSGNKAVQSRTREVKDFIIYRLEQVEKVFAENHVSGGILNARIDGLDTALCCYTGGHTRSIRQFEQLFSKLKEGGELSEEEAANEPALASCPRCKRIYPDQDRRVCPKCLDKGSIFLRVLSFLPRYKKLTFLILLCMFLNVGLNLLSPYLGGSILFDSVLSNEGAHYGEIGLVVLLVVLSKVAAQGMGIIFGRINAEMAAEVVFDLKT